MTSPRETVKDTLWTHLPPSKHQAQSTSYGCQALARQQLRCHCSEAHLQLLPGTRHCLPGGLSTLIVSVPVPRDSRKLRAAARGLDKKTKSLFGQGGKDRGRIKHT